MKISYGATAFLLALMPVAAVAAQPEPPPSWTGFYAGLNAGYSWDASKSASVSTAGTADPAWTPSGLPGSASGQQAASFLAALSSGTAGVSANGFMGGVQAGYNQQLTTYLVGGVEVDFQGSAMRGRGTFSKTSSWGGGFGPFTGTVEVPYQVYSDGAGYWSITQGGNTTIPTTIYVPYSLTGSGSYGLNGNSSTVVTKSVNSLSTVRGRIGDLISPGLLAYATGGLAFGRVDSSTATAQTFGGALSASGTFATSSPYVNPCAAPGDPYCGLTNYSGSNSVAFPLNGASMIRSSYSGTKVGWTFGGGLEWMIATNWSVKGEYLYYSLGTVTTGGTGALINPQTGAVQAYMTQVTHVSFDGHIARAGINYHF